MQKPEDLKIIETTEHGETLPIADGGCYIYNGERAVIVEISEITLSVDQLCQIRDWIQEAIIWRMGH